MSIFGINREDVEKERRSRAKASLRRNAGIRKLENKVKTQEARLKYIKVKADIESQKARIRRDRKADRFSVSGFLKKSGNKKSGKMRII